MHRVAVLLALAACTDIKEIGGGAGLDLPYFDVVYQCDLTDIVVDQRGDEQASTVTYEWCYDGSARELVQQIVAVGLAREARCEPTPRHLGPCIFCCGDNCGRGANAYNGSFCW